MSDAPYNSLQEDEKDSDVSVASLHPYHSTIVASAPAVLCRRLCRSYGSTRILHSLNLTVPTGSIYALLGPSGCGKVTFNSITLKTRDHSSSAFISHTGLILSLSSVLLRPLCFTVSPAD